MNKQQLASKIWESANKMRSKIEANEYKDYILGFIFYKFLSDKEVKFLKDNDFTDDDIKNIKEEDSEVLGFIQGRIGYFISYENLFSTWLEMKSDFDVSDVRDALSAFSRLINDSHKKVFEGIFQTLETGLSKLGTSSKEQTKAIRDLLELIKDIPMDGKQDYDVLGFIYEYLISNFAANAGKKAGEFYTPHEVSLLMSDIIANHLKNKSEIKIYDPCSGSGSLLINIGKSVSKYLKEEDSIKYYAQELKEPTYNLTRMNLVMRGIKPDNIVVRNGDTLEDDWPYFDETNPIESYEPLYVDAVTSNPPYSQKWDPSEKESDPRYAEYSLAPKGKADYAFLLHDLYHVKPDGIMTIVLPHGVLFRGGEEGVIREKLIEKNKIDTIIGLPANIFFGTGIPTIIMVLKQQRDNTDILIIDASKGFVKDGKNNKLRACDIKKITDAIKNRTDIDKFCRVVSRDEIRKNDYNLNIPRYVDSSGKSDTWDIYASMFGGIPNIEVDEYKNIWDAFPTLKEELFKSINDSYYEIKAESVKETIKNNIDVKAFICKYKEAFDDFDSYLNSYLINENETLNILQAKEVIGSDIFKRLKEIALIDKYEAYQLFDDEWNTISNDLEIIQTEGFECVKQVDPNMVVKKKDNKEQEIQDGWIGHIIPFELVQKNNLKDELDKLTLLENKISEVESERDELMESLSEDDKEKLLNEDKTAFVAKEIASAKKDVFDEIETPESILLNEYLTISKKAEKKEFINKHNEISWNLMKATSDGIYVKSEINKYVNHIKSTVELKKDSYEYAICRIDFLLNEEKRLSKLIKEEKEHLHILTKTTIENLTDEQAKQLLAEKWIYPLINSLNKMPESIISNITAKVEKLSQKYSITFSQLEADIKRTQNDLIELSNELEGNEYDMQGIEELKSILGGE